jgi:hypothetical protein
MVTDNDSPTLDQIWPVARELYNEVLAERDKLLAFHDRVVAIALNERADHHSIGWAIVSLVDEEQSR